MAARYLAWPRCVCPAGPMLPSSRKDGDEDDEGDVGEEGHDGHDAAARAPSTAARVHTKLELRVVEHDLLRLLADATRAQDAQERGGPPDGEEDEPDEEEPRVEGAAAGLGPAAPSGPAGGLYTRGLCGSRMWYAVLPERAIEDWMDWAPREDGRNDLRLDQEPTLAAVSPEGSCPAEPGATRSGSRGGPVFGDGKTRARATS
ncbi:hypothetical protein B0H14DRAFT_2610685 [Mycena olivaceomarginata]|nr:hypothetical protein B0H14DRAFT_2610685 [Mycena olivaceomarginata]